MSVISDEYAVYLPAVNTIYADSIIKEVPEDRQFPKGFTQRDLEFWRKGSKLWHQPQFLHSVGQYKVGSTPDNAVTRRGRTDGVLFGDSGGFQIGKGTLSGINGLEPDMDPDRACAEWRGSDARLWIMNWLETHTNYAMTIDMPLWATTPENAGTPFHKCSIQQLTDLTVENLQLIDTLRQGRTKWLNVIQGFDLGSITDWWNAVKWFPCNGYGMSSSGAKMSGMNSLIAPLLMMRDDGAFVEGKDWIHILGVSTAPWAIMFTAIQKAMRTHVNPAMRISYDSSSPFQQAARYEQYVEVPNFTNDPKSWTIKFFDPPQSRLNVGSPNPLPFSSPIADKLTLGDLNVNEGMFDYKHLDHFSLAFLANHNIWVYLTSFQRANDLVYKTNRSDVPKLFSECVDLIDYVFGVENWASALENEAALLKLSSRAELLQKLELTLRFTGVQQLGACARRSRSSTLGLMTSDGGPRAT